jgi:hypothetical protein
MTSSDPRRVEIYCPHWEYMKIEGTGQLGWFFGSNAKINLDMTAKCNKCNHITNVKHEYWGWPWGEFTKSFLNCICGNSLDFVTYEKDSPIICRMLPQQRYISHIASFNNFGRTFAHHKMHIITGIELTGSNINDQRLRLITDTNHEYLIRTVNNINREFEIICNTSYYYDKPQRTLDQSQRISVNEVVKLMHLTEPNDNFYQNLFNAIKL